MNSQQFLLLNIAILVFFVVWFLAGRRGGQKSPTRLNLKRGNSAEGGVLQKEETSSEVVVKPSAATGRYSHPRFQKYLQDESSGGGTKELNVLFNYNGHTWDAYEVLGLPAGASLVDVTKAYQAALKSTEEESHEFLETAFKTILAKK